MKIELDHDNYTLIFSGHRGFSRLFRALQEEQVSQSFDEEAKRVLQRGQH